MATTPPSAKPNIAPSEERVKELRVFLLTLNNEGWKPGRATWGNDIADLLAILDEYQKMLMEKKND